jgi:hypothetical protein
MTKVGSKHGAVLRRLHRVSVDWSVRATPKLFNLKVLIIKRLSIAVKDGETPLSYSVWQEHEAVVKLLLEKGAQNHNNS